MFIWGGVIFSVVLVGLLGQGLFGAGFGLCWGQCKVGLGHLRKDPGKSHLRDHYFFSWTNLVMENEAGCIHYFGWKKQEHMR